MFGIIVDTFSELRDERVCFLTVVSRRDVDVLLSSFLFSFELNRTKSRSVSYAVCQTMSLSAEQR